MNLYQWIVNLVSVSMYLCLCRSLYVSLWIFIYVLYRYLWILYLNLYIFFCVHTIYVSLSMHLDTSFFIYVSLYLYLYQCISIHVSLFMHIYTVCIYIYVSLCIYLYLSFSFYVYLSVYLYLYIPIYLSQSMYLWISVCVSFLCINASVPMSKYLYLCIYLCISIMYSIYVICMCISYWRSPISLSNLLSFSLCRFSLSPAHSHFFTLSLSLYCIPSFHYIFLI